VAGDVKRRNTTRTNNDSKQRNALLIRSREEALAPGTPDGTKDRVAGGDTRLLNERDVPGECGQVSPATFKRSHINRQDNRAGARASGLTNEDLPAVASLRTARRAIQKDPNGSLTTAKLQ
jgi:hypothetical protein